MTKKIISYILICIMIIPIFSSLGSNRVMAENNEAFVVDDNGTITRYIGPKVSELEIPAVINGITVRKIADGVFRGQSLTDVILPDTLEEIGISSFENNNLSDIYIPELVKKIGENAFKLQKSEKNLVVVTGMNSITRLENGVFDNITKLIMYAPELKEVNKNAFIGNTYSYENSKDYVIIFTENNKNKYNLHSEENSYLIDPIIVKKNFIDISNGRELKKSQIDSGSFGGGFNNNQLLSDFEYRDGEVKEITNLDPITGYVLLDNKKSLTLRSGENEVDFEYKKFDVRGA